MKTAILKPDAAVLKRSFSKANVKRKLGPTIWWIARLVLLIGISYVILYPLLVKFSLVFMDQVDLKDLTVKWIPRHYTFDNIKIVVRITDYFSVLLKSMGYCALVALLQVGVCTMAGYGFARFKFRGRGLIFALVIGTLVIPPHTYMVQIYSQFKTLNTLNTIFPFVLLAITGMGIRSGLYIYILRQSFRGLPKELEEAANVDGAGSIRTFTQVLLPNVIPTTLVCFILSFVWQWNDTFYTGMFSPNMETMSQTLSGLRVTISTYLGGWNQTVGNMYTSMLINTASLLTVLPLIILFIVCQRFFVQGFERSGLVG